MAASSAREEAAMAGGSNVADRVSSPPHSPLCNPLARSDATWVPETKTRVLRPSNSTLNHPVWQVYEGPDIMKRPVISSRELPPLDPSLVPHCFLQKFSHPLTLPSIHVRPLDETTDDLVCYTLAPITSNLRGSLDPKAEVNTTPSEPASRAAEAGLTNSKKGSGPPCFESVKVEAGRDLEWFLCKKGMSRRHAVGSPGPPIPLAFSHSRNAATTRQVERSEGTVVSAHDGDKDRVSAHIHTNPNHVATDRRRPYLVPTLLNGQASSCITGDGSYSLDTFDPVEASHYSPGRLSYATIDESSSDKGSGGSRGRKGKQRDDSYKQWRGGYSGGDEKSYGDGEGDDQDDDDDNDDRPPRKKILKKTPMACHFCRGRKLKCDGGRPTCGNCARRSLACAYDEQVRRRGPGRKKNAMTPGQEAVQYQQSQASTSTTSLVSPVVRETHIPRLPGPPMPSYNYPVGNIPSTSGVSRQPEARANSTSEQPPPYQERHQYAQQEQYPRYPQHGRRESSYQQTHYQQLQPVQAAQATQPPQYGSLYPSHHLQEQATGSSSYLSHVAYGGSRSRDRSQERDQYLSDEDDERTSSSTSKRRAASPPEDTHPASRRRREDEDRD